MSSEPVEIRPSPSLLVVWLAGVVLACGGVGALAVAASGSGGDRALAAVVVFCGMALFGGCLTGHFFTIRYVVDDRHLTKDAGVLWKIRRVTPLEKITNLDVRQGPLDRMLGFAQIWIFTPSTGSNIPEERLVGVQKAFELKQLIMDRAERAKGAYSPSPVGAGTGEGTAPAEVVALLRQMASTLQNIEKKLDAGQRG